MRGLLNIQLLQVSLTVLTASEFIFPGNIHWQWIYLPSLRIKILLVPILVHNGVHQSTVIIIGVDTFNVTSEQLTIEDFCDVTTLLCCVGCVLWVGVGMYDGLVIQIVGWVHWSRSRVDVPIRLYCDQF